MGRTFTQLKKTLSKQELDEFCRKLALEYADSNCYFSSNYFCKQYGVTKSCFERVKEYSIVNNLVSDNTVNAMMKKSIENQKRHCKTAGITTIEKYAKLLNERRQNFEISVAIFFAENSDISKEELARRFGLKNSEVDLILVRSIENNVVDDNIVDAIERRSVRNAKNGTEQIVKTFFEGLRKKREANKKRVALN